MTFTITLIDALLSILILMGIFVLYQLIVLIKNLIPSLQSLQLILKDTAQIVSAAKTSTDHAQKALSEVGISMGLVSETLSHNKSPIKALTNLTNAITALVRLMRKPKK